MEFKLDETQETEIKTYVLDVVKDAIKQATTTSKPYLNRKEIAKYFGVAESTISYWASLGMPVAVIDGRKLYGKQSITNWLKSHEMPSQRQNKKPGNQVGQNIRLCGHFDRHQSQQSIFEQIVIEGAQKLGNQQREKTPGFQKIGSHSHSH